MMKGAQTAPLAIPGHGGDDLRDFERQEAKLFSDSLRAFAVLAELGQVADDVRVVALGAELAAGRAGARGEAVLGFARSLRGCAERLFGLRSEIAALKSETGAFNVIAWRDLSLLNGLGGALERMRAGGEDMSRHGEALDSIVRLCAGRSAGVREGIEGIAACLERLSAVAERVAGVAQEAGAMADRVGIEAARAPAFASEFKDAADALRDHVKRLKGMLDGARRAIRAAAARGASLRQRAANLPARP